MELIIACDASCLASIFLFITRVVSLVISLNAIEKVSGSAKPAETAISLIFYFFPEKDAGHGLSSPYSS